MIILKDISYYVCDANDNNILCNIYNIESIEKSSVLELDNDIDELMKICNEIYKSILSDLIQYNFYKNIDTIFDDIKSNKIVITINIQYTDLNKAIKGNRCKLGQYKTNSEFFKECGRSVLYIISYNYGWRKRYECYDEYTHMFPEMFRYELSDYDKSIESYKVGDIVKLKYPPYGYTHGVITDVYTDKANTPRVGRLYDVMWGDGKIVTLELDDDGLQVHHDDIEKVIGHNMNLVYIYASQTHAYDQEYIKELKKMAENESK